MRCKWNSNWHASYNWLELNSKILVGFFRVIFFVRIIHFSGPKSKKEMTLETRVSTHGIVKISSFEYLFCKVNLDQTVICVYNTKFVNYSSFSEWVQTLWNIKSYCHLKTNKFFNIFVEHDAQPFAIWTKCDLHNQIWPVWLLIHFIYIQANRVRSID